MNTLRKKAVPYWAIVAIVVILIAFGVVVTMLNNEFDSIVEELKAQNVPEIVKGQYTLIHYAPGWTNAIYITEYYYEGNYIHYKEKDSQVFKQLWAHAILPVDGWVEGDKLMDYGYWLSDDLGLGE